MTRLIYCLTMFILLASLSACASITSGKNQAISVTAVCGEQIVNDATCVLVSNKGKWHVKTPGSVVIQKSYGDLSISCEKGDSKGVESFVSKNNAGVWGNIIAGGLIGYAIDAGSGAGFDYPQEMTVALNPPCPEK